jgi:hypothetical protein
MRSAQRAPPRGGGSRPARTRRRHDRSSSRVPGGDSGASRHAREDPPSPRPFFVTGSRRRLRGESPGPRGPAVATTVSRWAIAGKPRALQGTHRTAEDYSSGFLSAFICDICGCLFRLPRSAFPVPRSPFRVPRSAFPVPRSPFRVPRSAFPVPRSPVTAASSPACPQDLRYRTAERPRAR